VASAERHDASLQMLYQSLVFSGFGGSFIGVPFSCWRVHLKSENIRTQPLGISIGSCFLHSPRDEANTARSICTTVFRVSGGFSSLVNTLTPPKGMVALNGLRGILLGNRAGLVSFNSLGLGSSLLIVIVHSNFLCASLILTLGKGQVLRGMKADRIAATCCSILK